MVGASDGDAICVTCFSASKDQLPGNLIAIFGVPAITSLGLSLDFILVNPLCLWTSASALPSLPFGHDGPLDFLDAAFSEDSDADSELPDLLEMSSDGPTISADSTASLAEPASSIVPARPAPATTALSVISVPVPAFLPALVPPTPTAFDTILGPVLEPEPAVLEPLEKMPTPDVSVQPSWLARLLLLLSFFLLTALPLRLPHRDALLATPDNGHSLFDEPPRAARRANGGLVGAASCLCDSGR